MQAAAGGPVLPPATGAERTKVLRACRALCLAPPAKAPSSILYRRSSWRSENQQILDLARRIRPGTGRLEGLVFVSKPRHTRLDLKKQLTSILSQKGYRADLTVLNAYKPGVSWLLEVVVKTLQGIEHPAEIELAYRSFKVEGGSLELPGRWLQEIFPGPDLLAGALGWKPDRIRLDPAAKSCRCVSHTSLEHAGAPGVYPGIHPFISRHALSRRPAAGGNQFIRLAEESACAGGGTPFSTGL